VHTVSDLGIEHLTLYYKVWSKSFNMLRSYCAIELFTRDLGVTLRSLTLELYDHNGANISSVGHSPLHTQI